MVLLRYKNHFSFYEYLGHVTIVKTIHYLILECTFIVHIFSNVEFRNKHFEITCIVVIEA